MDCFASLATTAEIVCVIIEGLIRRRKRTPDERRDIRGFGGSMVGARVHKFEPIGGRATDYLPRRGTSRAIVPGIEISASARDG